MRLGSLKIRHCGLYELKCRECNYAEASPPFKKWCTPKLPCGCHCRGGDPYAACPEHMGL